MPKEKVNVIVPPNMPNPPEQHEVEAAWILAEHYQQTIEFLKPIEGYQIKTPDIKMAGILWEIKSPTGNAKRTIRNNIDLAKTQSPNIVIDTRRTKHPDEWIVSELKKQCGIKKDIYRLIMITKDKNVLEIKWR